MTFQLSDTVIVLLTNFKYLVIKILFYSGDLKDEIAVLGSEFSYFHIGIPLLHLVLRLQFKVLLL